MNAETFTVFHLKRERTNYRTGDTIQSEDRTQRANHARRTASANLT